MERKTLFTLSDGKVRVNTAVIFPIERSSKKPIFRELHLSPNEELRSLLYIGCSDSTLHVYRVITRLDQEEVRYDVNTLLLQRKKIINAITGDFNNNNNNKEEDNVDNKINTSSGVTFLHLNNKQSIPYLLVLANGVLDLLHYGNLVSTGVFQHLPLPSYGNIITCCIAREQEDTQLLLQSLEEEEEEEEGQQQQEEEKYKIALLIKRWLILVEYTIKESYIIGEKKVKKGNNEIGETNSIECPHIIVPEGTQTMAWQRDFIITGSSREYCVFDVKTRQLQQRMEMIDPPLQGPLCRYINGKKNGEDNSFILIRIDNSQLALFDVTAKVELETATPVKMSENIIDFAWVPPFLIGVKTDGSILIRSWLDNEEVPCNNNITSSSSSSSSIYGFDGIPHNIFFTPLGICGVCSNSIQFLALMPRKTITLLYINAGFYERALQYVKYVSNDKNNELFRRIYSVCAGHALQCKKYTEAFHYFDLAAIPTLDLLALVPELLRPTKNIQQKEEKIILTWNSGEPYHRLYELLLQRRAFGIGTNTEEQKAIEFAIFLLYVLECVPYTDEELTNMFLLSKTLIPIECLRYVGDDGICPKPMIVPLVLACNNEFTEALQRCKSQRLIYEAAIILIMSGEEELYVKYFPWMLSVDATTALLAVIQSPKEIQQIIQVKQEKQKEKKYSPPVSLILPMIIGYGGYPLHEYLHYIIFIDHNTESRLHTLYASNLIDIIQSLQPFGVESMKSINVKVSAGNESGILGAARRALLTFLQFSSYYEFDFILSLLIEANLIEEQVLALEQSGDHIGALTKLVYELNDVPAAVQYCEEQHIRNIQRNKNIVIFSNEKKEEEISFKRDDIVQFGGNINTNENNFIFNEYFNILLHVLFVPPVGKQRLLLTALKILNDHSHCINPLSIMNSLPSEVCVAEISSYLIRAFQTLSNQVQMTEINTNATESILSDALRYHALLKQRSVYINEKRLCVVCGKSLGVGVSAVFPNLKVIHFRCFRAQELDPERGVPFRPDL